MKKFSKIALSVAAVSAVTAAMAVSAMAADTISATYDAETGLVTLDKVSDLESSYTLLVLNKQTDNVTAEDIAQIDQNDESKITSFKLPSGLATGTYYIRIGGDGTIQTGTLTIGETGEVESITIGDVNLDGEIASGDATMLARQQAKQSTGIGKVGTERTKPDGGTVIIGDVNLDGEIASGDATMLARQQAKQSTGIGKVGQTVEVNK